MNQYQFKMKLLKKLENIFNIKRIKRDNFLVKEFEKGKILQIDKDIDNKKFIIEKNE